ncbi:MAG: 16S rRNA (cytosine(967)-C(5))-methyltransferase RsmB [Ruminococcaceae bacterium]|nr:16S rRNA (cytosine(967)-C(5))-methyltransferase RsmB [Oscillospiraceae bacterium]
MSAPRKIAYDVLVRCASAEQYSNIALDTAIKRSALTPPNRGLLTTLVYGVIERQITLDAIIDNLCNRGSKSISFDVRTLLRLGLYQLAYLDRVPDHAAVNETVNMSPKRNRAFVNAILRAFIRGGKKIPIPDKEKDAVGYLSVKYSFCPALCRKFIDTFSLERTEQLFAAFGEQPDLTLRTNTLRISREELIQKIEGQGIHALPTKESDAGIRVCDKSPVTELYGFLDGLFFVQDEASQLCVKALDAKPGMKILDACACPGSKSFGAAIDMNNKGSVLSCDLHRNKLSLVESGAQRLGITILTTEERDARNQKEEWIGAFDRVLCDVPCSGFGVFAKKPELRYKDPAASEALPDIQLAILKNASNYVKVGGKLVYSTCTLLPSENEENVARFLGENNNFELKEQRTLYPDTDETDGFFYAVMERVK